MKRDIFKDVKMQKHGGFYFIFFSVKAGYKSC